MIISFDEFCSRYVDFVGSWVEFVVDYTYHSEFLNDYETAEYLMDRYEELGCEEVCVSWSE